MRAAHALGCRCLRTYSSKFSRHDYTLPQLFACLVVREQMRLSYRGAEALLRDGRAWCRAIGMKRGKTPDHATLARAAAAILNGRRKKRVARGCGRSPQEVNELLRSFDEMRKMMKQLGGTKGLAAMKSMRGMDPQDLAAQMSGIDGGGGLDMGAFPGMGGQRAAVGAGARGPAGGGRPQNKRIPARKKKKRR